MIEFLVYYPFISAPPVLQIMWQRGQGSARINVLLSSPSTQPLEFLYWLQPSDRLMPQLPVLSPFFVSLYIAQGNLAGVDPTGVANKLADFVIQYNLDGIDIDFEVRDILLSFRSVIYIFLRTLTRGILVGLFLPILRCAHFL
jgi:hypothetical protein